MARPRLVSDEDILEGARTCFIEQGPHVSTAVIAEQVGLSQAALFKRFGTKQQLMLAALAPPEIPSWVALVEKGPDDRPIREQLREITAAMADFFKEMTPRLVTLWASGCNMREILTSFEVPPPVRGLRALTGWLTVARDAGRIDDCNPKAVALMMMGSMHGRAFLGTTLGPLVTENLDEYDTHLANTMWRGIAPKEGE